MNAVHPLPSRNPVQALSRPTTELAFRPTVVFDLDGTLVDTAPDLAASLNHCLERADIPGTSVDLVRPHAGHGAQAMLRAAYARAGRPLTDGELGEQTRCFLAYYADHIAVASTLYPGALAAMDRLAASGAILAICTNKTEALAHRLLAALSLTHRFAAICGADTFAARKPDPIHLLGTIAQAGGDPVSAIMIGDTETDVDAAHRAGIPSILVEFGYGADAAARAKASATIKLYADLAPTLVCELFDRSRAERRTA